MTADTTETKYVTYHREGHIGYITLNRPDKRNALNPKVWQALGEAVDEAGRDAEARVVLLVGAGVSFCAGLDLSPENEMFTEIMTAASAAQKTYFFRMAREAQAIHTRLDRLRQPTIAVIQKHCLGAGLELALCCDMLLATEDAIFALPEAKLAFITDVGGLQRLARTVPRCHLREISFRGHRFDARKAYEIGLLNYICPDEDSLKAKALEIAHEIAGNPPLAVQGAKEVMQYDEEAATIDESLEYNAARSAMIVPSEDQGEAIKAYLEKRPGNFKGA